MLNIRSILVAADFSACSEDAFQLALSLARDYGARVVVLHVSHSPEVETHRKGHGGPQNPDDHRADIVGRLHQVYPADSAVQLEHRLVEGEPADNIIKVAREASCDFIVMGTHGRTGLDRVLLGSVAEQVVREAPCPVLTVKVPLTGDLASVAAGLKQTGKTA